MNVLVACEYSGVVREAFRKRGHFALSCDLLPAEDNQDNSKFHYQGGIADLLYRGGWDLMIAHPPCTHLTGAVSRLWKEREVEQAEAIEFVKVLAEAPIERICIENPVGKLSTAWRKPDQIIQPYWFGDNASKKTCLWLKNLPSLKPTDFVEPRMVGNLPRWANQTDSGQNRLSPGPNRWKERSRTYQGIANAMAEQWG